MTNSEASDFELRLQTRLERLDAAIPMTSASRMSPAPAPIRPRRRRRVLPLLAAAALLLSASAVVAQRSLYPEFPEPRLEAALADVYAGHGCLTAAEARPAIQTKLDTLGYSGWTIESRPGAEAAPCAVAGVVPPEHTVIFMPATGQQLAEALESAAAELLRTCLGRADAMGFLSSVVTNSGLSDFSIHADPWGPKGGPSDQIEAYYEHVDAGCFVYVGTGNDAQGRRDFYLWGPWP
jgi:hypothetical protein